MPRLTPTHPHRTVIVRQAKGQSEKIEQRTVITALAGGAVPYFREPPRPQIFVASLLSWGGEEKNIFIKPAIPCGAATREARPNGRRKNAETARCAKRKKRRRNIRYPPPPACAPRRGARRRTVIGRELPIPAPEGRYVGRRRSIAPFAFYLLTYRRMPVGQFSACDRTAEHTRQGIENPNRRPRPIDPHGQYKMMYRRDRARSPKNNNPTEGQRRPRRRRGKRAPIDRHFQKPCFFGEAAFYLPYPVARFAPFLGRARGAALRSDCCPCGLGCACR